MFRGGLSVLVCQALLLAALHGAAASEPAGPAGRAGLTGLAPRTQGDAAWIEQQVEAYLRAGAVPGAAVAAVRGGTLRFAGGYGFTDLERQRPVTADTRFRVASVAKPVTALAVLRLVEGGRMRLDEPVHAYCPDYPDRQPGPTIRQLLAHQGGVPHTTDAEDTTIRGDVERLGHAVRRIADRPLRFEPGRETLYSSWGYALLGCAIEGATGRSYWSVISTDVLAPAGVLDAERDRPDFAAPDFSPGYRPDAGGVMQAALVVDTRFKTPASGLIISARGLMRVAMALTSGALLGEAMRSEMFRPHPPASGQPALYSLGWQVSTPFLGSPTFVLGGSMEGVTAIVALVPARQHAIVILANRERYVPQTVPLLRSLMTRLLSD